MMIQRYNVHTYQIKQSAKLIHKYQFKERQGLLQPATTWEIRPTNCRNYLAIKEINWQSLNLHTAIKAPHIQCHEEMKLIIQ